MSRLTLSLAEVALLAAWLGAALLFSAVVAPAAFSVLPSRSLAGALVGRVLPVLFVLGMVLGALLVVAELALRPAETRGRVGWGIPAAGAVLFAACATAQFVVGARIARLRAAIPGAIEALDTADPRRVAFGRLHALSVGWLGVGLLAALIAFLLAARAGARR